MLNFVLILHIIIAVAVIALVLLQHGKGADMGASFGSGSSTTIFGSRGAAPFLMKLTALLVALFFVTSLTLGHLSSEKAQDALQLPIPVVNKVDQQKSTAKDNSDKVDQILNKSDSDKDLINQIQKQSTSDTSK